MTPAATNWVALVAVCIAPLAAAGSERIAAFSEGGGGIGRDKAAAFDLSDDLRFSLGDALSAIVVNTLVSPATQGAKEVHTASDCAGNPGGLQEGCREVAFSAQSGPAFAGAPESSGTKLAQTSSPVAGDQVGSPSAGRAELFGLADPKEPESIRTSGFLESTIAYTYSSPAHWSRGVVRGRVAAEGALAEGAKWKLSGRVDVDPVYYLSDFYLSSVERDQRLYAIWGENYVDFNAAGLDFRIGAQDIVWGEVVGLFFADVVSALDLRDFLLPSFDIIRIPQWAARAEYFHGDSHLELVWIPIPTFDNIGKPGSDFYPVPLPSPTPAAVAAGFLDPQTPARNLANSNYGVRFNTLISGLDMSAFYYRSSSALPTFYRLPPGGAGQPAIFEPRHDRIWQAGGTIGKDFGSFVLHGEAVYTSGRGHSVTDLTVPNGVVELSTVDYIVSLDVPLGSDTRLNVQAFEQVFVDGSRGDLQIKTDGFGASVLLATKWGASWEPQVLWIQNFKDAGGLIRPRLAWRMAPNARVAFGVDIFTGDSDGFFGRYDNRDRLYTEFRYDF